VLHRDLATLARRFPATVGDTPAAHLTRWRMDLAAQRLRDSDDTVAAIARTMIPVNRVVVEIPARLDPESAEWLRVLGGAGPRREAALARLHGMLRIAQRETRRRGPRMLIAGPELEDLAYQAAADAR